MKLHTLQLGKWRVAKARGIPYLDITIKSGQVAFAPTWEMVAGSKSGQMTEAQYEQEYRRLMASSQEHYHEQWEKLLHTEEIAICCYCRKGTFCHRYLLKDILETECKKRGIPFEYLGELT